MKKILSSLLGKLKSNNIIKDVKSSALFFDEPKFHYFTADINKSLNSLKDIPFDLTAGGVSAVSPEKALIKCLMECVERYSLFVSTEQYRISSYLNLKNKALDPSLYTFSSNIQSSELSWTEGFNATTSENVLLPAQLVNLNNKKFTTEKLLTTVISTGAAGGFDHESALLGGIYELIERDAFMTIYLNKIQVPLIHLAGLKNKQILNILDAYNRYKLDVFVFDMTHDLEIPVFTTILVDRTGVGPAITVGAKAHMNSNVAIIGSMEEAFMARPWIRFEMLKNKKPNNKLHPSTSRLDRALLWSKKKNISKLDFLLHQNPVDFKTKKIRSKLIKKNELSHVIETLKKKGYRVFYKDITAKEFLSDGCKVYKTLVPGLQPLYLFKEEHNKKRLSVVSKFFGGHKNTINTFPHPFL